MECRYREACKSCGFKAKVFPKMCRDLRRKIGSPDLIILFTSTASHQLAMHAQEEAKNIVESAQARANQILEESEIVIQAKERARAIVQQTQEQARELMEQTQASAARLQSDADAYANQVFEQLIAHVGSTFKGVQQAEAGLNQAMNVLRTAKAQMNAPQGEQQ